MAVLAPYAAAARDALALALGREARASSPEAWSRVADVAIRERLGVIAWLRSAPTLRAAAPADVVARFRAHAIDQALRQRARLDAVRPALEALADAGVRVQLHKGMAVAVQLHGDPFARPSTDVDLVVAQAHRAAAARVLEELGWFRSEGRAPFEEAFERAGGGVVERIEVHSYLLGDKLAHLPPLESAGEAISIDDVAVTAVDREAAAIALATHWAGDGLAPLLYPLDWHVLWESLDAGARARVADRARALRVDRQLSWAMATSSRVAEVVAAGDDEAARSLGALGVAEGHGWAGHPAVRAVRHARTPADACAAIVAWARPPHLAGTAQGTAGALAVRALRGLANAATAGATARATRAHPAAAPVREHVRPLATETSELVQLVRAVAAAGGSLWVRVRGESMRPSIPSGTPIRLGPVPARPLRPGEVVLATLPGGTVVVHRVLGERDGVVRLRGDGNVSPDAPTARASVHALVELVDLGGRSVPIAERPTIAPRILLRRVRRAVGSLLASREG